MSALKLEIPTAEREIDGRTFVLREMSARNIEYYECLQSGIMKAMLTALNGVAQRRPDDLLAKIREIVATPAEEAGAARLLTEIDHALAEYDAGQTLTDDQIREAAANAERLSNKVLRLQLGEDVDDEWIAEHITYSRRRALAALQHELNATEEMEGIAGKLQGLLPAGR